MAVPRLVILDRDGVINRESPGFITEPDEWTPLPGSLEAIAALTRAGFTIVVATNQSGVARGLFSLATLELIHRRMVTTIEAAGGVIAGIFVCPHGPDDHCDCRKPLPGLFHQIGRRYGVSLAGVPAIGDSKRDIEAALAVGGRAILVRTGNGLTAEAELQRSVETFDDLRAAAAAIIAGLATP